MRKTEDSDRLLQAANCLPQTLFKPLNPFINQLSLNATELRLRLNRPFSVVCTSSTYYITQDGNMTGALTDKYMLTVSRADIDYVFQKICNYSVYNCQNEIVNGFVTMVGGHRAGISGTAVGSGGSITNIRDISSINIRIAREHLGCAGKLYEKVGVSDGGVLICGVPCSGKTTILRDYARLLSTSGDMSVSLIDERGELAGTSNGVYQNDIGMCDVFDGYPKAVGLMQAIRSMSPNVVVCDEIGSKEDTEAISYALNCGVSVVATVHCANEAELAQKKNICELARLGAFKTIVFLGDRNNIGTIRKISKVGDVFDI